MKQTVLGLAGEMFSGKSTAAKFLVEKFHAKQIKMSTLLNAVFNILDMPVTRENQQTLANILRDNFGEDVLAKALVGHVSSVKDRVVLIDGIRKLEELQEFKKFGNFKLIFFKAPEALRYERLKQHLEREGEKLKTFEEFQKSQTAATEVDIPKLEEFADFVLVNDKDEEVLQGQLTKFFTESL